MRSRIKVFGTLSEYFFWVNIRKMPNSTGEVNKGGTNYFECFLWSINGPRSYDPLEVGEFWCIQFTVVVVIHRGKHLADIAWTNALLFKRDLLSLLQIDMSIFVLVGCLRNSHGSASKRFKCPFRSAFLVVVECKLIVYTFFRCIMHLLGRYSSGSIFSHSPKTIYNRNMASSFHGFILPTNHIVRTNVMQVQS